MAQSHQVADLWRKTISARSRARALQSRARHRIDPQRESTADLSDEQIWNYMKQEIVRRGGNFKQRSGTVYVRYEDDSYNVINGLEIQVPRGQMRSYCEELFY